MAKDAEWHELNERVTKLAALVQLMRDVPKAGDLLRVRWAGCTR